MKPARRWAVFSVRGVMVGNALRTKDEAWEDAHDALRNRPWVWECERWDRFLSEAKHRGYYIARVEVREVER